MKPSRLACAAMQLTMLLSCDPAVPADSQEKIELAPVEVRALRDPVEKSYRRMVKGIELFEQRRSFAPRASLRFKLLPRTRDANMQGIALNIVSERLTIPVPVAPDNTFALTRLQQALDDDAVVTPDRPSRSMTWRTDIRTPGLPPDTRRLGDLRLECLVGSEAGLISDFLPFFGGLARLMTPRDYCDQREVRYLFFADRPLFSVTLVAGNRREVLSVDRLYAGISRNPMTTSELQHCDCEALVDRTYYAPLGDRSWPDDTLLEFDYMDEGVSGTSRGPSP